MQTHTHGVPQRIIMRAWWRIPRWRLCLISARRLAMFLAAAFILAFCFQVMMQREHEGMALLSPPTAVLNNIPDDHFATRVFLHGEREPAPTIPTAPITTTTTTTTPTTTTTTGPLLYLKVKVDNTTQVNFTDVISPLYNLPDRYREEDPPPLKYNGKPHCGRYPRVVDLSFNNVFWQVLHTSNGTFYYYNAFFDNRTRTEPGTSIRILGTSDRITPTVTTYCQLWYEGQAAPVTSKIIEYRYMWVRSYGNYKNGPMQPYLMQCVVPPKFRHVVPVSVSLVEGECDKPRNNLRVVHNLPPPGHEKKDFAVCVKGLDITLDISLRLIEWLELLFLLGADKVFLYDFGVHPNVTRVFRHYEALGRVDVRRLTLPGDQPTLQGLVRPYLKVKIVEKRQNEVVPYNDCLYRNMNLYKLVVLLDIDEVIMPRTAPNWRQMMKEFAPAVMAGTDHPHSSYYARNVYFLDSMQDPHGYAKDVPLFMHMMQHLYRAQNYTGPGSYVKAFHDPQRVLTLHNHLPFSCLPGGCPATSLPTSVAHLQHYRENCVAELRKKCPLFRNSTVLEESMLKFKEPLVKGVLNTLRALGFVQGSKTKQNEQR